MRIIIYDCEDFFSLSKSSQHLQKSRLIIIVVANTMVISTREIGLHMIWIRSKILERDLLQTF